MGFKIQARTLLHLGSELISSDGIALYELIKNSVDAYSDHVEVRVVITLTHTNYDMALERLAPTRASKASAKEWTVSEVKEWILGRVEETAPNEIRTRFIKIITAAKSKPQLQAALVQGYFECNYIQVEDFGEGMSLKDLDEIYLTIGTPSRRREKTFLDDDQFEFDLEDEPSQILLGDKGIGRLSTMRLGEVLEVETTRLNDKTFSNLNINWEDFNELDLLLDQVDVKPSRGKRKKGPAFQGTCITIRGIKADWTKRKFQKVVDVDFARLVDPFERRKANKLLRLFFNNNRFRVPEVPKRLLQNAHAWGRAKFFKSQKTKQYAFFGEVAYPDRGDWSKSFKVEWPELVSLLGVTKLDPDEELPQSALEKLGPIEVEFYWFNRRLLAEIDGLGTRKEVQAEVRQWAGGLMLFRDGFRVHPYGGPDDDWLELDKKALGAPGYKVNRSQIIGRVKASWRNKNLVDQTNREGLVDNLQKKGLMRLLRHLLITEFRQFLDHVDATIKAEERESLDAIEQRIEKSKQDAEKLLLEMIRRLPEEKASIDKILDKVNILAGYILDAQKVAEHNKDERDRLLHLAGTGLIVEFILHELGRSSSHALETLKGMDRGSIPQAEQAALSGLTEQLKTLEKRIDNLDHLSGARRQRKESFDLYEAVKQSADAHLGEAKRHNIRIKVNFADASKWKIKAVKGMFVQIVENILANAFYWLKVQSRVDENFKGLITIELDPNEKMITFSDNGHGVDQGDADHIFQAFVTRKPAGEGKGLGLYISREIAQYHDWQLYMSESVTKKTGRLNTFVLDMG